MPYNAVLLSFAVLLGVSGPMPMAQEASHTDSTPQHPANHLAGETSPYLLQHLHNPVDWYPWGPEALERSKKEDKPIFLSIGYSACHWCHVMERESFENEEIAKIMNELFVCIKVDREERPDVDAIYMAAVQRMTGSGGWPMSMFLTPDLTPYFGGTYYPPVSKFGRPGFDDVLRHASELWTTRREDVVKAGEQMVESLRAMSAKEGAGRMPGPELIKAASVSSSRSFDSQYGGFAQAPRFAPKFPHSTQLTFLLRYGKQNADQAAINMVTTTLDKMAQGGIYDQIGGGFARYSTDRTWTAPHFEKMLYDNSQLALIYMEAWQALDDPYYAQISREILDYVLKEMTSPEGGFYSTTDADSEGVEGKFFVWSLDEVKKICGEDADVAIVWFGVTSGGNFEGHNILTARTTLELVSKKVGKTRDEVLAAIERSKEKLYAARELRIHPLLDDKVLSSWNGLMLRSFARGAVVFDEPRYLAAAQRNAGFLLKEMRQEDGSLFRTRRGTKSHLDAYLEDHAFVAQGMLDLYEADFDPKWLAAAIELQDYIDDHFGDGGGSYYSTSDEDSELPVRMKEPSESSLPSAIGVALLNGARIGLLRGDMHQMARVRVGLSSHSLGMARYPSAFGQLVILTDFLTHQPPEVYVVGDRSDPRVAEELARLQKQWPPTRVIALVDDANRANLEALLPSIEGKVQVDGKPTVYACHEGVCEAPRVLD